MRRERAAQELRGGVEQAIEEAQKKGIFDNLPGKGKPLNLRKNPQAGENALAFDLLQNNDYTLPWIANRREMLEVIEAFRELTVDRHGSLELILEPTAVDIVRTDSGLRQQFRQVLNSGRATVYRYDGDDPVVMMLFTDDTDRAEFVEHGRGWSGGASKRRGARRRPRI
jgi:hypothetical protein